MKTLGISQKTGSFLLIEEGGLDAIGSYIEFKKVDDYAIEIVFPVSETVIATFAALSMLFTNDGSIHRGSTRRRHGVGLVDFEPNWNHKYQTGSASPGIRIGHD